MTTSMRTVCSRRGVCGGRALAAIVVAFFAAALPASTGSASSIRPPPPISAPTTRFDPERDVFSFANGLRWRYDQSVGSAREAEGNKANLFDQHCSQMARGVRQFYYTARFDPALPRVDEDTYRALVAQVVASDPRRTTALDPPIVIPGYPDLRSFSYDYESLLKGSLGGLWRAYHQRGNWRMVFPFSPRHQQRTAMDLLETLESGHPPIVHVMRFPLITVNHTLLLHRAESTPTEIRFSAYDPNEPERLVLLTYSRGEARFDLERTRYWKGGTVTAYEIFDGWLY